MGRAIVAGGKPAMEAPTTVIALADIAEGSIVKLNESGSPVEFYVAKHNYESAQNGTGRTLLVRKDVKEDTQFYTSAGYRVYPESRLVHWMEDYSELLDSPVRDAMSTTKIPVATAYSAWTGFTVEYFSYSAFPLSATELGYSNSNAPVEGSVLPAASIFMAAKMDGEAATYWTRSLQKSTSSSNLGAYYVDGTGAVKGGLNNQRDAHGARPCFTLPATALFDAKTIEFKGVS